MNTCRLFLKKKRKQNPKSLFQIHEECNFCITVNPLLSPPGGLFFSITFEAGGGGGGVNREGGLKREGGLI